MSDRIAGFRLGIYVFKDAEIVDFAAPHGVFSVARRFDPELDAFLIADSARPVQAQAGFTVLPNYSFSDRPAMDAFLIPGGFGTRQEMHNGRLHEYIRELPETTLLTSVCTGSWIYGVMGLLDGADRHQPQGARPRRGRPGGKVPIDRLRRDRPGLHDQPRPGGRRGPHHHGRRASRRAWRWASTCCAGPATTTRSIAEVARVMEYSAAWDLYRDDVEWTAA